MVKRIIKPGNSVSALLKPSSSPSPGPSFSICEHCQIQIMRDRNLQRRKQAENIQTVLCKNKLRCIFFVRLLFLSSRSLLYGCSLLLYFGAIANRRFPPKAAIRCFGTVLQKAPGSCHHQIASPPSGSIAVQYAPSKNKT